MTVMASEPSHGASAPLAIPAGTAQPAPARLALER